MRWAVGRAVGIGLVALAAQGCVAPPAPRPEPPLSCGPQAVIDDAEDGNARIADVGGRSGGWYTFRDSPASTVWPEPGGFTMSRGGAGASKLAARLMGNVGTVDIPYVALALDFRGPRGAYDASAYTGVSFFARRGSTSTDRIRFMVSDASTDPDAARCTECFNHFGVDLNVSTEWERFVLPFEKLRQLQGWGAPRPARIDPAALWSLVWQTQVPGADVDLWIDDVELLCH